MAPCSEKQSSADARRELLPCAVPATGQADAPEDAAGFLSRRALNPCPGQPLPPPSKVCSAAFGFFPVQVHFLVGLPKYSCSQSESPSGAGRSAKAAERRPLQSHHVRLRLSRVVHVCLFAR